MIGWGDWFQVSLVTLSSLLWLNFGASAASVHFNLTFVSSREGACSLPTSLDCTASQPNHSRNSDLDRVRVDQNRVSGDVA
jgi:hypothetical protein